MSLLRRFLKFLVRRLTCTWCTRSDIDDAWVLACPDCARTKLKAGTFVDTPRGPVA